MNKYEYDDLVANITALELKKKRIFFEKHYLFITKPYFFLRYERKKWKEKYNLLDAEEKTLRYSLYQLYSELESVICKSFES